ncbi:hypothetical protein MESS2_1650023 [Mesorhizobium metallidurans STM 2683]|uniref:Uncharacterized protein n=1 Tax=Mesorhizobium metallidurans STM 2683 TaxID=1297569 RepID=M5ENJ0_9HYPH|nr:hypothetical protein [Mesorhizobium metallidurans]CCV05740.1 hypothetical protein MESS2_1650023 [Mesorhizobium metallidurans STM 2683]
MSFRDIVVDACPKSDIRRTLEHAREMAVEFGAKLTVVSYAWPRTSIVGDVLAGNVFTVQEQTRAWKMLWGPRAVVWCSDLATCRFPNVVAAWKDCSHWSDGRQFSEAREG